MLDVSKTIAMSPVHSVRLIEASPAALRDMADRMDHASRDPVTDGVILCPFTGGVVLVYKPERSALPVPRESES